MLPFRLTQKAKDDLKRIGRFTQQKWGREQRNRYLSRLDNGFQMVARQPEIGKPCDYIRPGYRKLHIGRHLIFYRQSDTHIDIVRILHDRMDVENHF